jgi:hypothetical protein
MNNTWPISYKQKIESSAEELWSLIIKPGNLNLVHPFCKSNEIIEWKNNHYNDVLIYLNGLIYFREIIKLDDNKGYTLMIGKKRGKKSKVIWEITSSEKSTYLSITVYPYLLSTWPKIFSFIPYLLVIKPFLQKYLRSVIGGINWYLVNKKPVPKSFWETYMVF